MTTLYFIGILTPRNIDDTILGWKKYMQYHFNCKAALRSPAHITLIPPFNADTSQEEILIGMLNTFAKERKPFKINIKDFSSFPPRVIFAGIEKSSHLDIIKQSIEQFFLSKTSFKIKVDNRPFQPHITIANRDLAQNDFPKAWAYFQSLRYEESFIADAVSLLRNTASGWKVVANCPFK